MSDSKSYFDLPAEIQRLQAELEKAKWSTECQGEEYEKLYMENERLKRHCEGLEFVLKGISLPLSVQDLRVKEIERLKASQWVSVETELPEVDKIVFVNLHCESWPKPAQIDLGGRVDCDEGWYWCHAERWDPLSELDYQDPIEVDITHWMPLPSPPE